MKELRRFIEADINSKTEEFGYKAACRIERGTHPRDDHPLRDLKKVCSLGDKFLSFPPAVGKNFGKRCGLVPNVSEQPRIIQGLGGDEIGGQNSHRTFLSNMV
jgi:hypothetical protein